MLSTALAIATHKLVRDRLNKGRKYLVDLLRHLDDFARFDLNDCKHVLTFIAVLIEKPLNAEEKLHNENVEDVQSFVDWSPSNEKEEEQKEQTVTKQVDTAADTEPSRTIQDVLDLQNYYAPLLKTPCAYAPKEDKSVAFCDINQNLQDVKTLLTKQANAFRAKEVDWIRDDLSSRIYANMPADMHHELDEMGPLLLQIQAYWKEGKEMSGIDAATAGALPALVPSTPCHCASCTLLSRNTRPIGLACVHWVLITWHQTIAKCSPRSMMYATNGLLCWII